MSKILTKAHSLVATRAAALIAAPSVIIPKEGVSRGIQRTCDVAYPYRMPAGFSGDVNRTHPFSVEPCAMDQTSPILFYGQAGVIDATTKKFRRVLSGDSALTGIYGIAVRPYPVQQGNLNQGLGTAAPPLDQPIDVLRWGYIMAVVFGTPTKGQAVYVWSDADAGGEVAGKLTVTTTGGSTIGPLGGSTFQGAPDANGVTEVAFNIGPNI